MAPANPNQSRLESLPTELLEQIFLESLNVNLPLASSLLSTVLSSTPTKMAIVLKVFPSNESVNLEHYVELSQIVSAGSASDTETAIGELQSRILSCRWMTWDFLKLCMETFVVRTLLREFRDQNLPWLEGTPVEAQPRNAAKLPWHGGAPVKESVVREFVHELFALKFHTGIQYEDEYGQCEYTEEETQINRENFQKWQIERTEREYQWLGVATTKENESHIIDDVKRVLVTSSLRTYSWGPVDGVPRISIGIGPRNGLVILGTKLEGESDSGMREVTSCRWRCLWCRFDTKVPVKLLRGPWTYDQLSFLQALIDAGADLDPRNMTHGDIAKRGLAEAISQDNFGAVDLLITETMKEWDSQRYRRRYFDPYFGEAQFVMDACSDTTDWIKDTVQRRTLGIKPDTEHLKVAVTERGCQRQIVERLLWAKFSSIDRADPSVIGWAESKKEQGDEIGQWLLKQLRYSGHRDRECKDREWMDRECKDREWMDDDERASSCDWADFKSVSIWRRSRDGPRGNDHGGDEDETDSQDDDDHGGDKDETDPQDDDETDPQDDDESEEQRIWNRYSKRKWLG